MEEERSVRGKRCKRRELQEERRVRGETCKRGEV